MLQRLEDFPLIEPRAHYYDIECQLIAVGLHDLICTESPAIVLCRVQLHPLQPIIQNKQHS
jgi:hypothetical protein